MPYVFLMMILTLDAVNSEISKLMYFFSNDNLPKQLRGGNLICYCTGPPNPTNPICQQIKILILIIHTNIFLLHIYFSSYIVFIF